MTYGAKHSIAEQMDRIKSLRQIWTLFKRLRAPLWIKQRLLVQALWPRAFYGSSICCMSWEHIKQLRTDAMRGLAQKRGGASPGMRLAVLAPPATDPGYYQFWHTLRTFRRVARKQKGFSDLWCIFMHHFQGKPSFGPFGKLLEVCAQVGWRVDAPFLVDHDGEYVFILDRLPINSWRR